MIDLIELKNIDAIGNLITRKAKQFQDEREWEDYLASQGIGIEIDHAFGGSKRPPETMQIWDVGWNDRRLAQWRNGTTPFLIKKYLILPREFVEKTLILMMLP